MMWDERRDVPHDEEVARAAAHQDRGVDAGVTAGDDERARVLAVLQGVEELAVALQVRLLEVVKALDQVVEVGHGGVVAGFGLGGSVAPFGSRRAI